MAEKSTKKTRPTSARTQQRGGFAMGLIVGLLIGLAISLAVALYIAKIPVPFVNKVPQRTAEQDAAEAAKNKDWNPNAALAGKNPPRPQNVASGVVSTSPTGEAPPPTVAVVPPPAAVPAALPASRPAAAVSTRDPAAILGERPLPSNPPPLVASNRPAANDPFSYLVQAGAYGKQEDAEQQRAKLALMGMDAKVTEREQAGRTVYRVRVGPYDHREDADSAKNKLDGSGIEAALVRVQR